MAARGGITVLYINELGRTLGENKKIKCTRGKGGGGDREMRPMVVIFYLLVRRVLCFHQLALEKTKSKNRNSFVQAEIVCFVSLKISSDKYCIAKMSWNFPFSF